jgi:TM2 domain-containing membrane protein YozV
MLPAQDRFDFCRIGDQLTSMSSPGSTGNVIAALCSFFVPGLGQLLQGRMFVALVQFILACALWFILLGWVIHLWSVIDAAIYRGR